jgi:hypothetical protein
MNTSLNLSESDVRAWSRLYKVLKEVDENNKWRQQNESGIICDTDAGGHVRGQHVPVKEEEPYNRAEWQCAQESAQGDHW